MQSWAWPSPWSPASPSLFSCHLLRVCGSHFPASRPWTSRSTPTSPAGSTKSAVINGFVQPSDLLLWSVPYWPSCPLPNYNMDRTAHSVRLATGWKVRESNPGGGRIFCTRPDKPWGPPSLLYDGYWVSFLGVDFIQLNRVSILPAPETLLLFVFTPPMWILGSATSVCFCDLLLWSVPLVPYWPSCPLPELQHG